MRHSKGPKEGEFITIKSYKHDGSLHRTWRDTMVLKTSENALIGCNDHTLVTEADGRRWVTLGDSEIGRNGALAYSTLYLLRQIAMLSPDLLSANSGESA